MILVTGGAGYIGSHTVLELLNQGREVVVVDNLRNSSQESLKRVEALTGKQVLFAQVDVRDEEALDKIFKYPISAVIHFAGLKAVGESVKMPLRYYDNNVHGSIALMRVMMEHNVKKLIFSSSATVYGDPEFLPLTEEHSLRTTNPYGHTKLVVEDILRALHTSDTSWSIAILRYFNPVGAHESGLIGEDPQGIPNNLMPYIAQVAVGRRESVNVFGNDYDTPDGTGVRDYIHVVDLALGHLQALDILDTPQCTAINLGTGKGYSVLDVIHAFEKASGKKVPYTIAPRRAGDIAACYAESSKAKSLLGWRAKYDLAKMCESSWNFQLQNPKGYNE